MLEINCMHIHLWPFLFLLPSKQNFPKFNGNYDSIQDHLKPSIKKYHFNGIAIINAMCFVMLYAYTFPILLSYNILISLYIRTLINNSHFVNISIFFFSVQNLVKSWGNVTCKIIGGFTDAILSESHGNFKMDMWNLTIPNLTNRVHILNKANTIKRKQSQVSPYFSEDLDS